MIKISEFPPLYILDNYTFPNPLLEFEGGLVGGSKDLHPQRILNGYSNGFFPWYQAEDGYFHWYIPDFRMILNTNKVRKTKNLLKKMRSNNWDFKINNDFENVIKGCATIPRKTENWINENFIKAYIELHHLGYALSVESYYKGELVGGFYGVGIGKYFGGESMFAKKSDASKLALIYFCNLCVENGIEWIDCQTGSDHLMRMGAHKISKNEFLKILKKAIKG
jgi:leucyl/phenylalanyl-tRNA--protein transferase